MKKGYQSRSDMFIDKMLEKKKGKLEEQLEMLNKE